MNELISLYKAFFKLEKSRTKMKEKNVFLSLLFCVLYISVNMSVCI